MIGTVLFMAIAVAEPAIDRSEYMADEVKRDRIREEAIADILNEPADVRKSPEVALVIEALRREVARSRNPELTDLPNINVAGVPGLSLEDAMVLISSSIDYTFVATGDDILSRKIARAVPPTFDNLWALTQWISDETDTVIVTFDESRMFLIQERPNDDG